MHLEDFKRRRFNKFDVILRSVSGETFSVTPKHLGDLVLVDFSFLWLELELFVATCTQGKCRAKEQK